MKIRFLISFLCLCFGLLLFKAQTKNPIREQIELYRSQLDKDKAIKKINFKKKENKKLVQYSYWKKGNEIVEISRSWNNKNGVYIDTTQQNFLLKKGKRIYASESITYEKKNNKDDVGGWSVQFWINKGKVIDMTSTGHGKTEMDDWDYEKELESNFQSMIKTVRAADKK
jgi:hypothetical protein